MSDHLHCKRPLTCWQGERGTYHLIILNDELADTIAMHARLRRLELGRQRGFGSVKVVARVGNTSWTTSVFPQDGKTQWFLLISKKVMLAEKLTVDRPVMLDLELL